ncbi:unnamed protein product [Staurois parvus]|uniref:Uncharacterized protein n=2 Tax=Staurois parvus TaxID=386267 RepID=A0ABN9E0U0_9NEOB|nr:unnamed protein product [Staurois parvus]
MCANEAVVMGTDRLHRWALIGGTDEEALVGRGGLTTHGAPGQ